MEKLVGQVEKYEKEIAEGAKNVCDLYDVKIKNIRFQTNVLNLKVIQIPYIFSPFSNLLSILLNLPHQLLNLLISSYMMDMVLNFS